MKTVLLALMFVLGISATRAAAGACRGDSAEARFLPRVIGRPYSNLRTPFRMPCDTMEVRIGDTVTIYPGIMMHFGPVSKPEDVILVRGRLEVLGSDEAPVNFSGTLGEGDFGIIPGTGAWGGFRVDAAGAVLLKNVRIFKSVPIMASHSYSVAFSKVLLKQSDDLVGPTGSYYPVQFKETRIDTLNFLEPSATRATAVHDSSSSPAVTSSSGFASRTWTAIGGSAILAGAGLWWYLYGSEAKPTPSGPDTKYPNRPQFPSGTP